MSNFEELLHTLPTTAISDALAGTTNVNAAIKPLKDQYHIAGRAVTVRLPIGENGALLEAIRIAQPGSILVVDAKGDTNRAVAGDFVVSLMKGMEIQGLVVDGVIRDIQAIRDLNFPVFSLGTTVAAGNKFGGGMIQVLVAVGGISVQPGDFIVGDTDGVVVIPQSQVKEVIQKAQNKLAKDEARALAVANGKENIIAYLDQAIGKEKA
ncbi:RraA family protein [Rummeliibacillus suwonensis]|uniref:RraA family protein n=1 Tax=Rummeliibacillus suwonensis TaxID=1306154 RepID=UPI001AAFB2EB|nr:RraA family protein [Rummeliibacillus suwonensis]MBO2535280.1 RraA family protein [Rummeliibacillus suwonensis]